MRNFFLLLLSASGCGNNALADKALPAVKVLRASQGAGETSARYSASVEPATRVDVAFKVGGYVESIFEVKGVGGKAHILGEGDAVRKGQVLATLRVTDYEQKHGEAAAALDQANAAAAQSSVDFERAKSLRANGSISAADFDAAKARFDTTSAQSRGALARLQEANTALSDTKVRAPMDGVIAKRGIELGTLAGAGTVAFSLVDTTSVRAVFGVPDRVVLDLQLGAAQRLTCEALRGVPIDGTISRIAPAADPRTRLFQIEITIANDDGRLKPGMIASLELAKANAATANVAVIPLSAIIRSPAHKEKYAVLIADTEDGVGKVHARDVELGDFMGNLIPVTSGLSGDDRVVVTGAGLLSDGQTVRVVP